MGAKLKTVAETGLQFFGEITASNSHEIKNILAIINENAGLLEDLALMYDRGAQIEPQRLKKEPQTSWWRRMQAGLYHLLPESQL